LKTTTRKTTSRMRHLKVPKTTLQFSVNHQRWVAESTNLTMCV